MAFYHGVKTRELPTSLVAPVQIDSGLPVIIGTAPIHLATDEEAAENAKLFHVFPPRFILDTAARASLGRHNDGARLPLGQSTACTSGSSALSIITKTLGPVVMLPTNERQPSSKSTDASSLTKASRLSLAGLMQKAPWK